MTTPEIDYLAQAYFHPDYDLDADSPIEVIRMYRSAEAPETVAALRRSLHELLSSGLSEDALTDAWLTEAAAQYDPRKDGLRVSEWLHQILDEIS